MVKEGEIILKIKENKNGQRRVTIPKDFKTDGEYVIIRKHE